MRINIGPIQMRRRIKIGPLKIGVKKIGTAEDLTKELIEQDTLLTEQDTTIEDIIEALQNKSAGGNVALQEKTVIPTKEQQIVEADKDYDGLSKVTVEGIEADTLEIVPSIEEQEFVGLYEIINVAKVDNTIDSNIKPENIRKNETILGVGGTLVELVGEEKEVTPTKEIQVITPSENKNGITKITIEPIPNEYIVPTDTKEISSNGIYDIREYQNVDVNVDIEPVLQDKEITENGEYTADEGYDGLGKVNVNVATSADNTEYLNFLNRTFGDTYYAPEGAIQIPTYTFYSNTTLKKLVCSNTIKSLGGWCCRQATNLEEVILSEGFTSIGQYAFYGCTNLSKINIPSSLKSLDMYCFHSCSKLTSIILPDGMKTLPNYSFYNCYGLTEFRIPETVTNINNYALSGCSALTRLTVPASVVNVGQHGLRVGFITNKATLIMKGETPPTIASNSFVINEIEKILVPANAVDKYKTATNWSAFADIIEANV